LFGVVYYESIRTSDLAAQTTVAALPSILGDDKPKALPASSALDELKERIALLAKDLTAKNAKEIKAELMALSG